VIRSASKPILVFSVWTLFVWAQRVVNVFTVAKLTPADQAGALVRPIVFTVLGLMCGYVALRPQPAVTTRRVVGGAAGVTVIQWLVQGVLIALRDYSTGFIVVHIVLGVVSVAVALWALRSTAGKDESSVDSPAVGGGLKQQQRPVAQGGL
jgi:hypothetical protein